jgi:hypothetical protein
MDDLWLLSVKLVNAGKAIPRTNRPTATWALEIYDSIRQVLIRDWDPLVIKNHKDRRNDYDECIAPLYRILLGTRSKDELIECLQRSERDEFGVGPYSREFLFPVAEKLLSLNVDLNVGPDLCIETTSASEM